MTDATPSLFDALPIKPGELLSMRHAARNLYESAMLAVDECDCFSTARSALCNALEEYEVSRNIREEWGDTDKPERRGA